VTDVKPDKGPEGTTATAEGTPVPSDVSGTDTSWLLAPCLEGTLSWRANLLNELIGIEAASTHLPEPETGVNYSYRPYPLGKFGKLLLTVLKAPGVTFTRSRFLEVGCGPGTKIVLVDKVFGMTADGFDYDLNLSRIAQENLEGFQTSDAYAWQDDAEVFNDYRRYGVVFLNRPMRDYDREVALEKRVYNSMANDAFLILANALTTPPYWRVIAQDVACAVYQKTCRCEGAEIFLEYARQNYDDIAGVRCKLCGTVHSLTG
jgi:hypothetical protein